MALPRCYLVYAVAPEGTSAREANDLLNACIEAPGRGLPVLHDGTTIEPLREAEPDGRRFWWRRRQTARS